MKNSSLVASTILAVAIVVSSIIVSASIRKASGADDAIVLQRTQTSPTDREHVPTTNPLTWGSSLLAADEPLQPGDVLEVSVSDLTGPGVISTRVCRIGKNNMIRLWLIGDMPATGGGSDKLEPAIADAYKKANLVNQAVVTVTARRPRD